MSDNVPANKNADMYGLSDEAAAASRAEFGGNLLTRKKRKSLIKSFFGNFGDPMIRVLLIALSINVVFLFGRSNWFESLGIAAAVLIAVLVSTASEYVSESAFERLQSEANNITCRAKRSGKTVILPFSQVVKGDIILLGAGDKIPADGVLISGKIDVDQSALNGESKEAKKYVCGKKCDAASNKNDFLHPGLLFGGTVVTAGEAVMRVTAVGDNTFYGSLAGEIQEATPDSPLKIKLSRLAKKISLYGYTGAGLVAFSYLFKVLIIANKFNGAAIMATLSSGGMIFSHLLNALTLAVTVIVMAVPEGLPMMITVVLSSNMRRMLRDKVLVRRLNGIETAGSMNILFTDKTGTLTMGRLDVTAVVTGDGRSFTGGEQYAAGDYSDILAISLSKNNGAEMVDGQAVGGNATDRALLSFAQKIPAAKTAVQKINVIPFSSDAKFMATTAVYKGKTVTLIKGAPEKILDACNHYYDSSGKAMPLFNKNALQRIIDDMGKNAVRIIAVATMEGMPGKEGGTIFSSLTLVGLIGVRDRVRAEAALGVSRVQSAGIQTVMITGDAKATAVAIAKETGIIKSDTDIVLTSDELAKMDDGTLAGILKDLRVVARALPADKSRLVRIAQSLNLVVGMTGDGVNDAPALKKADIGFAMGSGSEVAKEAGDVVILDDNIMSVSRAISYGRTIFKSIRKFIVFQLTINLCAMAVSIIAPILGVETPITVIQMLWINLVMDTLAGLAFGGERPRVKYMSEPPKRRDEPIINGHMWQQIIVTAAYISFLSIWFLNGYIASRMFSGKSNAYVMTAFFSLFMFIAIFNSLNARTHRLNLLDYLALNKQFIFIMSSIAAIQILLVYVGGTIFRTVPLSPWHLILTVLIALSVIPLDLIRKLIAGRKGKYIGT